MEPLGLADLQPQLAQCFGLLGCQIQEGIWFSVSGSGFGAFDDELLGPELPTRSQWPMANGSCSFIMSRSLPPLCTTSLRQCSTAYCCFLTCPD